MCVGTSNVVQADLSMIHQEIRNAVNEFEDRYKRRTDTNFAVHRNGSGTDAVFDWWAERNGYTRVKIEAKYGNSEQREKDFLRVGAGMARWNSPELKKTNVLLIGIFKGSTDKPRAICRLAKKDPEFNRNFTVHEVELKRSVSQAAQLPLIGINPVTSSSRRLSA